MKKSLLLRLCLIMALLLNLHSCIHEEMYSSESASQEYSSKSLWKEDEKYIKNVMKVYFENEEEIKKVSGTPLWDYAMTMDRFDESFLMVPVVERGKVIAVLNVPRKGRRVYFTYTYVENDIEFFQNLISSRIKKAVKTHIDNTTEKIVCTTKTISVFNPDDESNPNGPGHWESHSVTECKRQELESCLGEVLPDGTCLGGGTEDPGYPYPGGGGDEDPQPEQENPCEKTKNILDNPQVQAKINELKTQSTAGGEKGVKFKTDGTPSAIITGGAHSVNFGDKTGYAGAYHNHTPTGIPMLSPPDIDQLLGFARAQPTSNPANVNNAFMGMVAPNGMHYVIWFSGTYQDALTNFSQDDLKNLKNKYTELASDLTEQLLYGTTYINSSGSINDKGVEKLFFETLKNMNLQGKINLQRIESDGTVKIVSLNSSNQPTSSTCSQ